MCTEDCWWQVVDDGYSQASSDEVQLNSGWLHLAIDLEFTPAVESYKELRDDQMQKYLEFKAATSKEVVTNDMIDKILLDLLVIDMTCKDTQSRIQDLFVSYKSILCW